MRRGLQLFLFIYSFPLMAENFIQSVGKTEVHEVFKDPAVVKVFTDCLHKGQVESNKNNQNKNKNNQNQSNQNNNNGNNQNGGGGLTSFDDNKASEIRDCLNKNLGKDKAEEIEQAIADMDDEQNQDDDGNNSDRLKNPFVSENSTEKKLMRNLEDALYKRLQEAIYGVVIDDVKSDSGLLDDIKRIPDHRDFLKIYESQIGRSLIAQITTYCSEADPNSGYLLIEDAEKRACVRKDNLKELSKTQGGQTGGQGGGNISSNPQGGGGNSGNGQGQNQAQSTSFAHWNNCIQFLPYICQQTTVSKPDIEKNQGRYPSAVRKPISYANNQNKSQNNQSGANGGNQTPPASGTSSPGQNNQPSDVCTFADFTYPAKDSPDCQEEKSNGSKNKSSGKQSTPNDPNNQNNPNQKQGNTCDEEYAYGKRDLRHSAAMACKIHKTITALKKSIVSTKALNKKLDEQEKINSATGVAFSKADKDGNFKEFKKYRGKSEGDDPGDEKSVDELTGMTSGFLGRAIDEDAQSSLREIEECIKEDNVDKCSQYIAKPIQNADELLVQAQAELVAKANAEAAKVEAMEEDEFKEHLQKTEGYSESMIEKFIKEHNGFENFKKNVAEAILDRAYNTAAAMKRHKELAEQDAKSQLKAKKAAIEDQIKRAKEIRHYHNIATGPLSIEVDKGDGQTEFKSNYQMTFEELEDSAIKDKGSVDKVRDSLNNRGIAAEPNNDQGDNEKLSAPTITADPVNEQLTPVIDKSRKISPGAGFGQGSGSGGTNNPQQSSGGAPPN